MRHFILITGICFVLAACERLELPGLTPGNLCVGPEVKLPVVVEGTLALEPESDSLDDSPFQGRLGILARQEGTLAFDISHAMLKASAVPDHPVRVRVVIAGQSDDSGANLCIASTLTVL